jgi:hypothetical protein
VNRHQRRKMEATSETAKSFDAQDTMTQESQVFSAELLDAIHKTIERSASYMPEGDEVATMGRVVQGLGLTASAFAMGIGANEKQFVEAMRLYYQMTAKELQAARKAMGKEAPSIILAKN